MDFSVLASYKVLGTVVNWVCHSTILFSVFLSDVIVLESRRRLYSWASSWFLLCTTRSHSCCQSLSAASFLGRWPTTQFIYHLIKKLKKKYKPFSIKPTGHSIWTFVSPINNQPTDKVPGPVGYNTMKKGWSWSIYGI